ncbi:Uncharacterised protein [Mycobacteroides abscessus subsp. abscessus]|nr:Uncharacterised protein [Mycobacteroides abscessus subsp. abscessus]
MPTMSSCANRSRVLRQARSAAGAAVAGACAFVDDVFSFEGSEALPPQAVSAATTRPVSTVPARILMGPWCHAPGSRRASRSPRYLRKTSFSVISKAFR